MIHVRIRKQFPARPDSAAFSLDVERERGGVRPRGECLADARLHHYAVCLETTRFASERIRIARPEMINTNMRASAPLPDSTAS